MGRSLSSRIAWSIRKSSRKPELHRELSKKTNTFQGWKEGSAVNSTNCFSRRCGNSVSTTQMAAYICNSSSVIQHLLLASIGTGHIHTYKHSYIFKKKNKTPGVVGHGFNSLSQKAETSRFETSLVYISVLISKHESKAEHIQI